jgi:hypothetical protein
MEKLSAACLATLMLATLCAGGCLPRGDRPPVTVIEAGPEASEWTGPSEAAPAEKPPLPEEIVQQPLGDLRPIPEIRTSPGQPGGEGAQQAPAGQGVAANMPAPKPGQLVLDDFENALRWKAVDWANANQCALSLARVDDGGALALDCKDGAQGKAGAVLEFPSPWDATGFSLLSLDVSVRAGEPQSVAIAWLTDGYFESTRKQLSRGRQEALTFPLTSADYETAPRWEYNVALSGLTGVRAVYVLLYYEKACAVSVDNVRLLGGAEVGAQEAPGAVPPVEQ